MESNDSPEIPDRGETSDIPGLPSGGNDKKVILDDNNMKKPSGQGRRGEGGGTSTFFCCCFRNTATGNDSTTCQAGRIPKTSDGQSCPRPR